jgi:uncharacterized membrane protein YhaH (DUF805 family)
LDSFHQIKIVQTLVNLFIGGYMNHKQFYFSFTGRVNRAAYWLRYVLPTFIITIALIIIIAKYVSLARVRFYIFLIWAILYNWMSYAVAAKRYHDRDKSAWWILIYLIPVIGPFWQLIELGFLKGTDGSNRFGADPLGTDASTKPIEP